MTGIAAETRLPKMIRLNEDDRHRRDSARAMSSDTVSFTSSKMADCPPT